MPLDKLVQRILEDAREYGERIVSEAQIRRLEVMEQADQEAAEKSAEILESVRRAAELERQQQVTAAFIRARKYLLETKRMIMAGVLDRAVETIISSPREEYIGILVAQLTELGPDVQGELILSPDDRERLGEEVVERANRQVRESDGSGSIALSSETRRIAGGFILKTPEVEFNCSLDAQIESQREEIEEETVRILFGEKTWSSSFD